MRKRYAQLPIGSIYKSVKGSMIFLSTWGYHCHQWLQVEPSLCACIIVPNNWVHKQVRTTEDDVNSCPFYHWRSALGSPTSLELSPSPLPWGAPARSLWRFSHHASRIQRHENLVCTCKTKGRFLCVDWLRNSFGCRAIIWFSGMFLGKKAVRFFFRVKSIACHYLWPAQYLLQMQPKCSLSFEIVLFRIPLRCEWSVVLAWVFTMVVKEKWKKTSFISVGRCELL